MFAAYDNVGILKPKIKLSKETLVYISILLNRARWRFCYGRKCYKEKLNSFKILLPSNQDHTLNQEYVKNSIENRDLFNYFT